MSNVEFLTGIVWESKPGYSRVHIDEDDNEAGYTTDWLPMLFMHTLGDTEAITLKKDTQVKLLMKDDRRDGVILGAIYSETDTVPSEANENTWVKKFEDGTVLVYDKQAHKLTADIKGDIEVTASGKLDADISGDTTIKAPRVLIDGDLSVTGKIDAVGNITTSGKVDATDKVVSAVEVEAGIIKLTLHKHISASPGSPTGPSIP